MSKRSSPTIVMEITIISAEGIKPKSSSPFITLATSWLPDGSPEPAPAPSPPRVYRTSPDDRSGGMTLTWGDKFRISIPHDVVLHPSNHFFQIRLLGNRFINMGKKQLGWCQIPLNDVINPSSAILAAGLVHRLSYRLRNKDGSRGDGFVNIGVKSEGSLPDVINPQRRQRIMPEMGFGESSTTVIGVPLGFPPRGLPLDRAMGFRYWSEPPPPDGRI